MMQCHFSLLGFMGKRKKDRKGFFAGCHLHSYSSSFSQFSLFPKCKQLQSSELSPMFFCLFSKQGKRRAPNQGSMSSLLLPSVRQTRLLQPAALLRGTGLPAIRHLQQALPVPCALFHSSTAPRDKVTVSINKVEVKVPRGVTVLQACQEAGIELPRFCYHERLSVAGNCRMCLVEISPGPPKPQAACALPVMPGMKISTDTPRVKKAREGVMEFLLINHPLDCPICDQGGECDLQEESMAFGSDRSRFREWKRTVEDKDIGPLVKTVMTRCIQCTRCVRFADEIAGVPVLGTTGRGTGMEIGSYIPKKFDSEMSGNVVDLCPVGALTSKPYAFNARPWELRATMTIDVQDAIGSNIRLDARGADILRCLPRLNEEVNEEWISDKTRYSCDGLKRQRLDMPYLRKGDVFEKCTWKEALEAVAAKLQSTKPSEMMALAGPLVDIEALVSVKDLLSSFGCSDFRSDSPDQLDADLRASYLLNCSIVGVEESDQLLLVGTNPRMEAPTLNTRIRKCVFQYGLPVANIGPAADLAFHEPVEELGNDLSVLSKVADGNHPYAQSLAKAEKPLIILGMSLFKRNDVPKLRAVLKKLVEKFPKLNSDGWNGLGVLHSEAGRAGQLDVGFVPGPNEIWTLALFRLDVGFVPGPNVDTSTYAKAKLVYLLGADDSVTLDKLAPDAFVVYQGHHGDAGAARADVILPAPAFTENYGTYVNTEGRVQRTTAVNAPVGEARENWQIVRAISEVAGKPLPFDSLEQVVARAVDIAPHLAVHDRLQESAMPAHPGSSPLAQSGALSGPIAPLMTDFYLTNPITRASKTMATASKELPVSRNSYMKA
eukprot:g30277.t1